MRTLGIMLLLLVALQGCGRKGPLFMPPPPADAQAAPDQSEQKKQP
jgi:predicted small lipoprotein YifL